MFRPNRLTLIGVAAALVCLPARVSALQRPAGAARVAPDFDIREGRAAAPNVPQGTNGARVHRVRFDRTLDGIPVFDASEVSGTAIGDDGVQATPAYLRGGIVGAEEAVRLAAGNVRASLDAFRPVVVRREPGPDEQTIPGAGTAHEFVVITRRKLRDTALNELTASGRLLEGSEWEEAASLLVDRRRSRNGPPSEALARWRKTCDILELTLNAPAG